MRKKPFFGAAFATLAMLSCNTHYQLTGVERTRIIIDSRYDQTPDEAAAKYLEPFRRVNDSVMGPVMGRVARNMHPTRPESDLSNLLADILIWASKDYGEKPVLAVYNMGGIRSDLTKGDVTYGDVLAIAPFENKICFVTMTGEQLMELFSQIAATGGEGLTLEVNFLPFGVDATALLEDRKTAFPELPVSEIFTGMLHNRLGRMLVKYAGVDAAKPLRELDEGERARLAEAATAFRLPVKGTEGFDNAQVTAGGLRTADFDPNTLESRLVPGLFACGELLDVDGDCGGFNLQWAWASGRLAGRLGA